MIRQCSCFVPPPPLACEASIQLPLPSTHLRCQLTTACSNDPWWDLESYMNWEPNSWNDRRWTVAQGVGLFKHVDPTKF